MRSFEAVKLVLDKAPRDLTPIQRLVLIQIAHRQPKCFPTVKQLALEIGVSQEATVSRATKELAARGLIRIERRKKNSSIYHLQIDAFTPMFDVGIRETLPMNDEVFDPRLTTSNTHAPRMPNKQLTNNITNADFDVFWGVYPRKVNRVNALAEWSKVIPNLATPEMLISAARTYGEYVKSQGVEDRFVLSPVSWLKNERWLDVLEFDVDDDWMLRAIDD